LLITKGLLRRNFSTTSSKSLKSKERHKDTQEGTDFLESLINSELYLIKKENLIKMTDFDGLSTLRKSQAQFGEKLRKLSLRQNYGFLIKKITCIDFTSFLHSKY